MREVIPAKKQPDMIWRAFILFIAVSAIMQLFVAYAKPPQMAEAWISNIAYSGVSFIEPDIFLSWSVGMGKTFLWIHSIVYKLFGCGIFQCRMVTIASGYILAWLVYRWTKQRYGIVSVYATALLMVSPSFAIFLTDGRQDVLHCLLAFATFYLITSRYLAWAGLIAALSVDIDFRGIEIVLVCLIFMMCYPKRLRNISYFMAGASIGFIYWICLNVVPVGLNNFLTYVVPAAANDGGIYSWRILLSEPMRIYRYLTMSGYIAIIELIAFIILCRKWNKDMILWIAITFIVMTIIEKQSYPSHMLLYTPFLCIVAGRSLDQKGGI